MSRAHTGRTGPATLTRLALLLSAMALAVAHAQQTPAPAPAATPPAPARDMPRPEELEPAVDTTRAPVPAASAPLTDSRASGPQAKEPAASGGAAGASRKQAPPSAGGARKGPDRLQLDTTDITGNRELPKVLYIVPWKRSDLGDIAGRPVNSLLDEVLQPLDRDVFKRENRYYDALKPDRAVPKADLSTGSGDKP